VLDTGELLAGVAASPAAGPGLARPRIRTHNDHKTEG
jgi:hypothetical protein